MGEPGAGTVIPDLFGKMEADPNKPWQVNSFASPARRWSTSSRPRPVSIWRSTISRWAGPRMAHLGPAPAQVIDLTAKLRPDGSLDWTPPKGNWRIIRLGYSLLGTTNHPAPAEATGLEVDKFDGDAVRRYLDHYLAMYDDAAGPGMMGKRCARAADRFHRGGRGQLDAQADRPVQGLARLRSHALAAYAGGRAGRQPRRCRRFLFDWRRTLGDLMASQHYGTVAKVAHERGLKVYGEALEDHRPSLGDDMAMRSHTDIPMSAMWTFGQKAGPNPSYIADIKGAASVAHIYGQNWWRPRA
jgi:hypothetical protein